MRAQIGGDGVIFGIADLGTAADHLINGLFPSSAVSALPDHDGNRVAGAAFRTDQFTPRPGRQQRKIRLCILCGRRADRGRQHQRGERQVFNHAPALSPTRAVPVWD